MDYTHGNLNEYIVVEVRLATSWETWHIIAGAKRCFRPRGFSIAGASAPIAPTVPMPLILSPHTFTLWL